MPQVPYTGVPSVAPGGVPLSRYRAGVSPATFGANVGQAIESLGGQLKSSGNELFERGIAMQTLYNHSAAQEADAKFMEQAGMLHAEYNSLQGKAAVDALPAHMEALKKTREEIGKGLPNEMAQKLYDSSTHSMVGRSIFSAAGHAATENKKYALGASTARVSAIGNQTLSQPENDRAFDSGLQTTEAEVRAQANLQGLSSEATEEAVSMQKSALWSQRIKGMAKQDPIKAGKWLEDGIKRGDIRGEDIAKVTNLVDQQRRTVGSRMISNQVTQGEGIQWGVKPVDIRQAAEAIGAIESGGRYNLVGIQTAHGRALGKYQVMEEFLPEFLQKAGMPPMSRDEFLKSPQAQDQVFNAVFGQYMKQTGSANDAASMWFSGKPMAEAGARKDALGTTVPAYVARFNAALAKNAPLSAKIEMGKSIAAQQAPDDPLFPEYVEQRIQTDHNRVIAVKKDDEFRNRQTIEEGLMGGKEGTLPTTVEELTNTPEKSEAWEKLLPSTQRRYMGVLARNAKGDTNWTDESLRDYQRLKGLAHSNPADFLDTDVIAAELPNSAKRELINLQGRLQVKAEADPRTTRAMQIIQKEFPGGVPVRKDDKDSYDRFVGNVIDQIRDTAEEKKRPPTYDEIKTIGSRLIQQQHSDRFWFRSSTDNMYKIPVPPEIIKESKALDPNLTDEEIQRRYTRVLYQKLYGGMIKSEANAPMSK